MTNVTVEIRIDAPREQVWDVLANLGSVSVWNPALTGSYYTSEAKQGLEAARHCDFPDGGYVKERVLEWNPGESFKVEIYEGTIPFDNATGSASVVDDGDGTIVTYGIEYDLKSDVPVDPQEVERQNREELLPLVLASLKQYVETGEPMPMPEAAESDTYLKSGS